MNTPVQPAKPAHTSKVIIANVILIALAIADVVDAIQLDFMSEEYWALSIGILNVALRFVTGQPIRLTKP